MSMMRRVAALALVAVAVASVALIYPRLKNNPLKEYAFQHEPWMDVVPTGWDEVTALFLGRWAEDPELAKHLTGPSIQLLGVRGATFAPKDVEVLVLPPSGCLADCDSPVPTRATIYLLKNESARRLYKAMAVSGTLRYRHSGFTVFFAVGRMPDGKRDRDYASLAAFRDDLMILVWGSPKEAKAALEQLLSLSEGEKLFDDEGMRKAFAITSSGLRQLKFRAGGGDLLGLQARRVVLTLGIDEDGGVRLRAAAATGGVGELSPETLERAVSNLTSLQGVSLSPTESYSGDGVVVVEFEIPREQLEVALTKL